VRRVAYELTSCPACGSAESLELIDADQMRGEVELLWGFHERRLRPGVPPERLTDRLAFSQHPPLRLAECRHCAHIYRNPIERKETLEAAYANSPPDRTVLEGIFAAQRKTSRRQVGRLTQVARKAGRGLEVGCYAGGFLAAANDAGWTFQGLDLSPEVCAFVREKGFRVTSEKLERFPGQKRFDAIVIWNTFEQLYDPRGALLAARRLLHEPGVLALRFPNGRFYREWRARLVGPLKGLALRLLAHNNLLSFPYRQGFTESSIATLLASSGFQVLETHGDTLPRVADQWTTSYGAFEERWVKRLQRRTMRRWNAPWIEIYAGLAPT
jgi:SAM-dependent methyltransferase